MEFTGERFIPGAGLDSEIEVEHLQRYFSVLDLVAGKIVLDAASGAGYGTNILAEHAAKAYGLEISDEAVAFSMQNYVRDNLQYTQGSIDNLPFADNSLDVVVSFETIEHVDEELQHSFIKEIRRVLKDDGILLMSSPDKHIYSELRNYKNEHHIKEFYRDEFVDFLEPHFEHIKLFDQFAELSYLLLGENRNLKRLTFDETPFNGRYIIALCSNSEIPVEMTIESLVVDKKKSYQDKLDRIASLQDEVDEKNDVIDEKNTLCYRAFSELFNEEEKADFGKKEILDAKVALQNKELSILELAEKLKKFEQELQDRDQTINDLKSSLEHIRETKGHKFLQKCYLMKDRLLFKK